MFELDYEAPGGLILGVNEVYTKAEDPFGSLSEYKLGVQTKRWYNDLNTRIGFNFSNRFKALGYYNFYKQDYAKTQDFTQDYYVNEFGVGGQIKILPKTWGFIRYHYGEQDYFSHPSGTGVTDDNDADHNWNRVNAGLIWDTGGKLGGELNFGYQWLDFDNAVDARNNKYHNVNTWIAGTSVDYEATSTTQLELNIARTPRTTNAARNEYYDDTSIGVNLQQGLPFLSKLTLSGGVRYSNNDYNRQENRRRKDDNWFADIILNYHIQDWLRAGVGYNYKTKDSNQGEYDYTDNRFMISLGAAY
ncbi:MAG: hypothetical protein BA865_04730 [Desulfobacterales bacterium S5133MH4]|nr:MAG: hypothetical protein BA865_04730 [Desulfobacterales bacterium S5133MH4]